MSDPKPATTPTGGKKTRYQWKPWKIGLVVFAGLLVLAGGALGIMAASGGGPGESATTTAGVGGPGGSEVKGFGGTVGTTGGGNVTVEFGGSENQEEAGTYSPALLRGGVSFFVAFCLAFALRAFLRIGAIFVGIWALSVFVLAYLGWVEVHWDQIDAAFKGVTTNIGEQFQTFQTFVTGSLPSTGLAVAGLLAGFKWK